MNDQILLYLAAGLDVLIPMTALVILFIRHRFRLTSVLGGIAAYFFTCEIFIPGFTVIMSAIGLGEAFWSEHAILAEIINVLLNVLIGDLALYLILRFTLKNRSRLYDAMALGISYWLYSAIRLAISAVGYGRLAMMAEQGRLSEMVTENLSLERLQELADELKSAGISSFYVQLVGIIAMTILTVTVCLFLYYALKRSDAKVLFISIGVHYVVMLAINLALYLKGDLAYVIGCVIGSAIAGYIFYRFMQWYREQQRELAQRRKAYKEGLKTTSPTNEE